MIRGPRQGRARPCAATGARAAIALLVSLASACVAAPPFSARSGDLVVRAKNERSAKEALREVGLVREELRERIPGLVDRPVEVWLQEELSARFLGTRSRETTYGFTLEPWLGNTPEIHLLEDDWISCLPHELTHAWLGPNWRPLPGILQEGLCDLMAEELGPFPGLGSLRVRHAALAGDLTAVFRWNTSTAGGKAARRELTSFTGTMPVAPAPVPLERALALELRSGWRARPSTEVGHLYGLGYVFARWIVERGGVRALHELCLRAAREQLDLVPLAWIEAAAGLRDAQDFERRLAQEVEREHVSLLLHSGDLGGWVLTSRAQAGAAGRVLEAWLVYAEPTLALGNGPERPLQSVEGLLAWLSDTWTMWEDKLEEWRNSTPGLDPGKSP